MEPKIKLTFVVPENLQNDMRKKIIEVGYSMRDKSRWISEAIQDLLMLDNYADLVFYGDELKGFQKVETIVISRDLRVLLENAILTIRRIYPTLEGVQSRIIRTSILQRLLRS